MDVVFFGTPEFAIPALDALVEAGHRVRCVVAQPDRPKGRGNRLQSPPTVERARAFGIEVRQPRAVRSGPFPEWLAQARPDVAVVVAYGRILPPALLAAPRLGCVNVHASLLPLYRGAAPVQWSLIRGERETGVCTMRMDEGLDTGDVLLRRGTPVGPDEDAAGLALRLSRLGAVLLVETLDRLDRIVPEPQDHARATQAPPLSRDDGRVDWSWPAGAVHDRVRGTHPWPGGQAVFRGESLKVVRTRLVGGEGSPGEVVEVGPRLVVACGHGAVELVAVQLPGRRAVSGSEFANGTRLSTGECLG